MRAVLPLLIAIVAAGIVFFMTTSGPVEACGRAAVTFVIALVLSALVFRKPKGE